NLGASARQPGQHHEAWAKAPVSRAAPRGVDRRGCYPFLDRFFLQPDCGVSDRVPADRQGPGRPAALPAGGLPRSRPRLLQRELLPPPGIRPTGVMKTSVALTSAAVTS